MALPVLILVLFLTLWVGMAAIDRGEMTIANRNQVWRQRATNSTSTPFQFSEFGKLTQSDEKKIQLGALFSEMPNVKTHHAVLGGSWDHRQLPMDSPPHWDLYRAAALAAPGNTFDNQIGEFEKVSQLAQALLQGMQEMVNGQVKELFDELLGPLNEILGRKDQAKQTAQGGYQSQLQKGKEQIPKMEELAARWKKEIEETLPAQLDQAKSSVTDAVGGVGREELKQLLDDENLKNVQEALDALQQAADRVDPGDTSSDVAKAAKDLERALNTAKLGLTSEERQKLVQLIPLDKLKQGATAIDGTIKEIVRKKELYRQKLRQIERAKEAVAQAEREAAAMNGTMDDTPDQVP